MEGEDRRGAAAEGRHGEGAREGAMTEKKKAKDGTLRGRPPLFGRAGDYERVYAEARPQVARRLKADAERRGVSASHLLCEIIDEMKPSDVEGAAVSFSKDDDLERVYAQVEPQVAGRLRRAAAAKGWAVARLLGVMVDIHYAAKPGSAKVGT
jgi:hypothetical protein